MQARLSQTEFAEPSVSAPYVRTLYLMHVLTHATRLRLDEALRELNLSSFQYTILSVLEHNDGLSSAKLSQRFHVKPQTMGEMIALLVAKGLIVRRENDTNRKILCLSLTDAGAQAVRAGDVIVGGLEINMLGGFDPAEVHIFRKMMRKMLSNLQDGEDHLVQEP